VRADPNPVRIAPAPNRAASEDGFILIEVLVSALILAIVAAGVMAVLSSTTHSAASLRVRTQAGALAQEDQARMRTMRISSLQRLEEERKGIKLDGTEFTVVSTGAFVGSATNEVVCNGETSATDYVRITSSVSSPTMPNAVVLTSMVAPSNGSLDQNHGTLSFTAKNAKGLPLSGVSLSGTGPGTFSGKTDSTGCANFADLPTGNYKVKSSANGMINMKGESSTEKEYGAPSAGTQTVALTYDSPGEIEAGFVYKSLTTGLLAAAKADSIEIYNGESGELARTFGTPGGGITTRFSKIEAKNVFPFKSKTTVYAGSCESNNPDPKEELPANRPAMAFLEVPPGGKAVATIQLPALNLTVTNNSGTAINGAAVTLTDTKCKSGSTSIRRTGYTTEAAGHLTEPWMPWGEYKVCARAVVNSATRKAEGTVLVNNLSTAASLNLKIENGSSTSECS
jgi:Tfp pilus assembly protein PilV